MAPPEVRPSREGYVGLCWLCPQSAAQISPRFPDKRESAGNSAKSAAKWSLCEMLWAAESLGSGGNFPKYRSRTTAWSRVKR